MNKKFIVFALISWISLSAVTAPVKRAVDNTKSRVDRVVSYCDSVLESSKSLVLDLYKSI